MGVPDSSPFDLIKKFKSWISWGGSNLSKEFEVQDNNSKMCCDCDTKLTELCPRYHCRNCGRVFCGKCNQLAVDRHLDSIVGGGSKFCRFCSEISMRHEVEKRSSGKIYPLASPRQSPEPPSPLAGGIIDGAMSTDQIRSDQLARVFESREQGYSPHSVSWSNVSSFSGHPSPVSVRDSYCRSDEEEAEDSVKHFFSTSSEFYQDVSDIDCSSFSGRHEFYSFKSVGSSPSDSPSRNYFTSDSVEHSAQLDILGSSRSQNCSIDPENRAVLKNPDTGTEDPGNTDDLSIFPDQSEQKPLDFENNGLIWFPPPPEDEDDDAESNFFLYDDEDDDIGESGAIFSSSSSLASMFPAKEKHHEGNKEPLRAVVQRHFRALVSQLLQGEGIIVGKEDYVEDWLDIVTSVAWQAANFVKPDTSKGGSMDPVDYVKVKCIATGSPSESTLVKGVVCTKNIKHKRMSSQYKNPRLLLLGGALEYQRAPNQLASFDGLLQQEMDHLKMIVSKIEAHRPNVLLVEKSVSSYAQEYLLAKEISLVLNVKRPLLERIARCTGALITPSIDKISATRLGHCELFRLDKMSEEHETPNQFNKRPCKTLMFFEGCPRRLCCTILLKGSCREELKKIKHVVQYAVFAAYHLSLETSFLADEGASLPTLTLTPSIALPERTTTDHAISATPSYDASTICQAVSVVPCQNEGPIRFNVDIRGYESLPEHLNPGHDLVSNVDLESCSLEQCNDSSEPTMFPFDISKHSQPELLKTMTREGRQPGEICDLMRPERIVENVVSNEYFSAADSHQSILVSFSSCCVLKGTMCERSRLHRIKFYGCFDKPLGRYLRDNLFDQGSSCRSCQEQAEAHVQCFTHQQGSLTINVRRILSLKLPGERDGKIWMWHRCLKCAHVDGIPPANRRVVMSDAAWGLSFGKFLELSFSNHATANRVATCGHSLQRDCLRYYGLGSMVAFFRYSPIDILSVHLPPSVLEFSGHGQQDWIKKETAELMGKTEILYAEISDVLDSFEQTFTSSGHDSSDRSELHSHIVELKYLVKKERNNCTGLLQSGLENSPSSQTAIDILELNRLRRSLLIGSHIWDWRLYSLDSLMKMKNSSFKVSQRGASYTDLKDWKSELLTEDDKFDHGHEENISESLRLQECLKNELQSQQKDELNFPPLKSYVSEDSILTSCHPKKVEEVHSDGEITLTRSSWESVSSPASNLSDKIDSAWTGTDQLPLKAPLQTDGPPADNPTHRRLLSPLRVYSFDSATRVQERMLKGLPPSSLHLSQLKSFHASGDYRNMVRDPVANVPRSYSHISPREAQKLSFLLGSTPSFISSASHIAEGARLLLPQTGLSNIVIAVFDNEPASIISYALSSKEYEDWIADKPYERGGLSFKDSYKEHATSKISAWHSFGSLDMDYIHYGHYGSEDAVSTLGSLITDSKKSPHLRFSFGDKSTSGSKMKFSVTCYFAKQFDALRKKCCPSEVDFVRSLSRCKRWSAQGGKSNVYFAKSLDDRFIIKQVTKTELDSFEEFAHQYFKYLTESLTSGSPTCLAKVLGIYQVTVKPLQGGKETKMDLMVIENLFFKRNISRVYDLKGSSRSRYNSDTTGANKVLLDTNLLETLHTKPIFLGSKAKRSLERAVWNDTSFLASVDVMDYSLLVGVDEERKELVLGIIDYMRQYTWDKHLETWVKASGILGGPKNTPPTIISPKQYKRRFRKAMTSYFHTVPDQWSS